MQFSVHFWFFINLGLKNEGMIYITKFANSYIKHSSDFLSVNDIVTCCVTDIDFEGFFKA